MHRAFGRSLALASLIFLGTQVAAHAQGSFYGFGDSQLDNGRFSRDLGFPSNEAQGYQGGRSINGPSWGEYLPGIVGLAYEPENIFAWGGAASGTSGLVDGFIPPDAPFSSTGFLGQIDEFEARGMRFAPEDVIGITIGGNDITGALLTGASPFVAVDTIAANMEIALDQLVALGGRNIVITGLFDRANYDYPAIGITGVDSDDQTAVSRAINAVFTSVERDGVNIHYLDLFELVERMQASPATYGFTSVVTTDACYLNNCASLSAEQQAQYLWMDYVHLSTASQAIIADYVARLLTAAPLTLANAQTGLVAVESFHRGALSQFGASAQTSGTSGPFRGYVLPHFTADNGTTYGVGQTSADTTIGGVSAGGEYAFNDVFSFGLAADLSTGETSFGNGLGESNITAGQIAGIVSANSGNFFADLGVSASIGSLELRRNGVIEDVSGDTNMNAFGTFAEVGYLFPAGSSGWSVGPVASASYIEVNVDRYTESGDSLLTISVDDQSHSQILATAGLRVEAHHLADERLTIGAQILGEYRDRDFDDLTYFQTNVPDRALVERGRSEDSFHLRLGLDAEHKLNDAWSVSLLSTGTLGRSGGNDFGVRTGVEFSF